MTLGRMLRETVRLHGERPGFVTVGKDPTSLTYSEVMERVRRYAAVFEEMGLKRGDRVALMSENCVEWALVDWACQCAGYVLVPLYPSLTPEQAEYIVRDCGATVAVAADDAQLAKVICIEGLRTIRLRGPGSLDQRATDTVPADLDAAIDGAEPEDLCTIIYTSGTTGQPKGVMLPNRAIAHVVIAAKRHLQVTHEDRFFSFLPLSHVYERVAGHALPVSLGSTICFSRGLPYMAKELSEFAPHLAMCVPRFLENLRERILDGVTKMPPVRQRLFNLMLSQGVKKARGEFAPLQPLLDRLVAKKVRERVGGQLRYFISGGAALSPAVAEFYIAVGLHVLQGYGLTETTGGSCINRPDDNRYWTVGQPLDMEIQIAPDGEILMRGGGLMLGYYHLPEETAKAIDPDGWFHTGDIGEFEGPNLKITDRKKDILVLANGKNIAPQAIENRLKTSLLISEAVVLGDGMDHCVALVIPRADVIRKRLGLEESALLADNDAVRKLIKAEIDTVNRTMAPFEAVKKFALLENPFSIETGELTPSLKVKRKVVRDKFADIIQTLG